MLELLTFPNDILRKKSQTITNPTDDKIKKLIVEMTNTLRAHKGVGLAAPQVGENIKLCIIEIEDELFVLINPEIKKLSGKIILSEEGCLSFPGKFLQIERYEKVKVKAIDANGKKQIIRARGFFARALQHEIDHLEGTLFVDHSENSTSSSDVSEK